MIPSHRIQNNVEDQIFIIRFRNQGNRYTVRPSVRWTTAECSFANVSVNGLPGHLTEHIIVCYIAQCIQEKNLWSWWRSVWSGSLDACVTYVALHVYVFIQGVPGGMFLTLKYTDITQNTCIRSWTATEIMAREFWKYDSCYTLIDYQIHIKTARNMSFL